jgi:Tol biopolymer transport system component
VLTAVTVATGETKALTTASSGGRGDSLPAVSPDGKRLAFVRRSGVLTGELYVQGLSGDIELIGDRLRLGPEGLLYHGVAWSVDGENLIVSAGGVADAAHCGDYRSKDATSSSDSRLRAKNVVSRRWRSNRGGSLSRLRGGTKTSGAFRCQHREKRPEIPSL